MAYGAENCKPADSPTTPTHLHLLTEHLVLSTFPRIDQLLSRVGTTPYAWISLPFNGIFDNANSSKKYIIFPLKTLFLLETNYFSVDTVDQDKASLKYLLKIYIVCCDTPSDVLPIYTDTIFYPFSPLLLCH